MKNFLIFLALVIPIFSLADGNILTTYKLSDGIAYLYKSECHLGDLSESYPHKFETFKNGSSEKMGEGCYSVIESTRQVLFANPDGSVVTVGIKAIQDSNKSWWDKFSENVEQGYQQSQRAQSNRPPVVNLTPSTTLGTNPGSSQPIDLGGKFKQKNCISTVNGNQVYTNCY